ncbi:hypothetical protein [Lysinibacillus sp. 3P01SB]|uniref:hypothetical protein n=1 Tax=Lysinibacillus sp. 3P01SB TaxID=3132284 RepID=UPI0039A57964
MKKYLWIIGVLLIFVLLHITPHAALRTHVFLMGYPIKALSSEILVDVYDVYDGEMEQDTKIYTLTDPPIEKATEGILSHYAVKKTGFLYFAEFYGY